MIQVIGMLICRCQEYLIPKKNDKILQYQFKKSVYTISSYYNEFNFFM